MNLSAAIYAIRWLIRDTFRQSLASGIFWLILTLSTIFIMVCLSVSATGKRSLADSEEPAEFLPRHDPDAEKAQKEPSGVDVVGGELTLGFGAFRVELGRDIRDAVHFLQLVLAGGVADAVGILLALIWTAGFLPSFLDPSAASVILAKPVPRWSLLIGKWLGVLVFVGFQALVFLLGTWVALGIRTGIWDSAYLLAFPLLLIHFAVFFSVSAFLGVCTRSTVTCVFGSILFWLLCWGMNYGRHAVIGLPELSHLPETVRTMVDIGYWILPKPADMGLILYDALQAGNAMVKPAEFQAVQAKGAFFPELSLLSSLAFMGVVLGLACWEFEHTDY